MYANGTGRRDSLCAFAVAGNQGCVTFKRNADGGADTLVFNRGTGNVWRLYQGYDASHRITAQDYDLAGLAPFDLTQSFDSLGRVRSRTSPKGGSYTRRVFRYDSLGFLRNVCDSLGSQCQNTVNGGTTGDAWTYDSTGNRTEVGTSDTYGDGNRLTARSTYALAYDSTGSLVCHRAGSCPGTTSAGTKYGWDALGRLREIRNAATGALVDSFAYDALNRRLVKKKGTGGTEYYVYAGSQVILDVDSTGAVLWEYAWYPGAVDRLFAVRTPADTFAAVLDPQTGSVRGLARFRTGGRVKEYAERPWGDVAADTGLVLRYRFAGREFDQESGLYYMRARYYDPAVGRWISEDPIGIRGGLNLYMYASNDPVNRADRTGLCDYATYVSAMRFWQEQMGATQEDAWAIVTHPEGVCPGGFTAPELEVVVGNGSTPEWIGCGADCGAGFGIPGLPIAFGGGATGTDGRHESDGEHSGSTPHRGVSCAAVAADAVLDFVLEAVGVGIAKRAANLSRAAWRAATRARYARANGRAGAAFGEGMAALVLSVESGEYSTAGLMGVMAQPVIGTALNGYDGLDLVKDLAGLTPWGVIANGAIGVGETVACIAE